MKLYLYLFLIHSSYQLAMEKQKLLQPFTLRNVIQPIQLQDTALANVAGPIAPEISLLVYAYKNYDRLHEMDMHIPSKILLFGPQASGKSYIVSELARKLKANFHQFSLFDADGAEKILKENCADVEQNLEHQTSNYLSIVHCQHAQNLFKNQNLDLLFTLINNHAQQVFEKKKVPTLFIAEQRMHPENEVIQYFDQVVQMPELEWKHRKQILEYYLTSKVIDWKKIESCLTDGMTAGQLLQIAYDAPLRAQLARHKAVTTKDLNETMKHWCKIYNLNGKNDSNCPQYIDMYS